MAKKSWLERNKKKQATVKKYAAVRAELKARGSDIKVLDRSITLGEIRQIAARNGLTAQLDRALRKLHR